MDKALFHRNGFYPSHLLSITLQIAGNYPSTRPKAQRPSWISLRRVAKKKKKKSDIVFVCALVCPPPLFLPSFESILDQRNVHLCGLDHNNAHKAFFFFYHFWSSHFNIPSHLFYFIQTLIHRTIPLHNASCSKDIKVSEGTASLPPLSYPSFSPFL